jgi:translation initiation factor 2 beta subunit (eIF-2beta)/eIF-5
MNKAQIIKKLRNLPQNSEKSDKEMDVLAEEELKKKEIITNSFCATPEEEEFVKDLLKKYLGQGSIETESDKMTLQQLLAQEVIAKRFERLLKDQYSTANPAQSLDLIDQLDKVVERISYLKKELGLSVKDKEQNSWLQHWIKLEKKCLNYYKEHAAETYTRCPKCQNVYRLLMRVENKDKSSATFFKGTKIYNKKLFSLYHEKRISEVEIAEILGVSIQYIQYIYNEVFLSEKKEDKC